MPQDPFPSPGCDGEEPDGSVPPPVTGNGPDAGAGPEQGLFVCLPAEDLDVARFTQHGTSDVMPPGPLLASVVHALAGEDGEGLAALSDDQLMGGGRFQDVRAAARAPAAPAATPRPSAATGPGGSCGTWSTPATPDVPLRAAGSPPPAATWTTPPPGTTAARTAGHSRASARRTYGRDH